MMDAVDQPSATMDMEPEDGDPDGPRVLPVPPDAPSPKEFAVTPRPDGAYPESTAHSEVVGYLYDPSRDSVVAARVGMREPEVTAWGDARPLAIERGVGAWDMTPTDDGIVLDEHDVEVEVPPVVARRLRAEAQKRPGEIIVVYEVRDYSHDIPTSTTTPSRRLQVLEDEPGDETTGWFTLEAGYAGGSGGRRETPDLREVPQRVEAVGGEGDQGREAGEGEEAKAPTAAQDAEGRPIPCSTAAAGRGRSGACRNSTTVRRAMKALTAEAAGEVINALAQGYGVQEVAAAFGVSRQTISAIKHGRAWGHLPRPQQLPQPCRTPVEARRCIVCSAGIDAERIRRFPTVMTCGRGCSARHRTELQRGLEAQVQAAWSESSAGHVRRASSPHRERGLVTT